jgi:hypothetical protein
VGDDAFVVLELIDGPSLAARLRERGALGSPEAAQLGTELADALAYIHAHGVVHRDVTPANVLCDADGHPRLVDFGIVRLLDTPRVTATAMTLGTAAFMAPEQVRGDDVSGAADVYALGLVLLEALTGARAFTGTMQEVALARLHRDPDVRAAPDPWPSLLARMTARQPAARPSATEVRDRLAALAAPEAVTAPVAVPAARPGEPTAELGADEDGDRTSVLGTASRTAVFPLPLLADEPGDGPRPPAPRRRAGVWMAAAAAAAALVLVITLAAASGPDEGPRTTPTTSTTVTAATAPVAPRTRATAPPTTASTTTTTAPTTTEAPTTTLLDPFAGQPPGHAKKDKGPGPGPGPAG